MSSQYVWPGEWTTVDLPWTQFVPVRRASVDPTAPPLNPNSIVQLGLVLSRFEFNGAPNAHFKAGSYSLQVGSFEFDVKSCATLACSWSQRISSLQSCSAVNP